MSECNSGPCPIRVWCEATQITEPDAIARVDTLIADARLSGLGIEFASGRDDPLIDEAVKSLDYKVVTSEQEFVESVISYSTLENIRTEIKAYGDSALTDYNTNLYDLAQSRDRSAERQHVAQQIEPFLQTCVNGLTYKRERRFSRKTIPTCGAAIPEELKSKQQRIVAATNAYFAALQNPNDTDKPLHPRNFGL